MVQQQISQQQMKEKQAKQSKEVLDRLVKNFENPEKLQDTVIKTFLDPIDTLQSKYSFLNRILLAMQGASDARGNAEWRKIDRYPLDWTKKAFISMPRIQKKTIQEKGKEPEEKIWTTGFFHKALYDIENTYGTSKKSKVEYVKNPPKSLPPLNEVAKKWGVKIEYKVANDSWGSYNPEKNKIQLGTDNAGTFFHELAHKAHERIDGKLKMKQDPEQETVAQLSAGVLSQIYGQKIDLETYEYIKTYADNDPKKAMQLIHKVLHKTGQVLELILGTSESIKKEKQPNT